MKKRVLMLTSAFPPYGGSGVQRVLKFVKYLDRLGWESHIISTDVDDRVDQSLCEEIPAETKIYRDKRKGEAVSSDGYVLEPRSSSLRKIITKLGMLFLVPDLSIWKTLRLMPLGKRTISRYGIAIVFASVPSFSIAIGGFLLKKATGVKFALDFRDPWAQSLAHQWGYLKRWVQCLLQDVCVSHADVVITNTKALEGAFRKRYKDKWIKTIHNGYDVSDFPEDFMERHAGEGPLTMIHVGEFYPNIRDPEPLLVAIGKLLEDGKVNGSSLKVRLIGGGELTQEERFVSIMSRHHLSEIISVEDFLPHKAAILAMMSADVLLLMQNSPEAYMQIPAKAFEYLYLRKPIFCLSPEGSTSSLIRDTDSGIVVDTKDPKEMERTILHLISLKRSGELKHHFSFCGVEQYARSVLAEELARVFEALSNAGQGSPS